MGQILHQVLLQVTSLPQKDTSLSTGLRIHLVQVLRHLQPVGINLVVLLATRLEQLEVISPVPLVTNLVQLALGTNLEQLVLHINLAQQVLRINLAQQVLRINLVQLVSHTSMAPQVTTNPNISLVQLGTNPEPPEALEGTNLRHPVTRLQPLVTTNPSILPLEQRKPVNLL